MPPPLVRKSQTYYDYKSTNTVKDILDVDCRGGIYHICTMVGFLSRKFVNAADYLTC